MSKRKLVTFDWAMKKLLRSKANFDILEGFLSELLRDDIQIIEILESESNKETVDNKFNRVDLKVKTQSGEIVVIEVQYDRQYDYLQRLAFATSKVITEHLHEGDAYGAITKVITVSIVYFDLGHGDDYVYHGYQVFEGMHTHNQLELSKDQQKLYNKQSITELLPEHYIIKVNTFNDIAKDPLDEWIYFFKNEEIKGEFKAKGLQKARVFFFLPHSGFVQQTHQRDAVSQPDFCKRAAKIGPTYIAHYADVSPLYQHW